MDLSGQKLGKYDLLEKLGQGGMAEVYKARQPTIERLVAIKVLLGQLAESSQFVERFKREAQRLGQMRHPNIVSVLDFDVDRGVNFLVMDYVSGPTLRIYLDQRRTLAPIEALRIASQITDALGYAHARGIIHCDMKPANVMFLDESRKQIVLTDFGIARLLDTSGSAQTSMQIGTPTYMSPEGVENKPIDGRADLYSLGIILYEMVTGKVPYEADTPISVMLQHLNAPLPDLRKIAPGLPEEYIQVVEKAMEKKPENRYQSAAEMHQAIQASLTALESRGALSTVRMVQPEGATRRVSPAGTSQLSGSVPSVVVTTQPPPERKRGMLGWGIAGLIVLVILCVGTIAVGAMALSGNLGSVPLAAGAKSTSTQSSPTPNRFGDLKVLLNEKGQPSQFQLHLDHITQPPASAAYVLWLGNAGQWTKAGKADALNGSIFAQLPAASDAVAHLQQAEVTLESNPDAASSPSDKVVFSGQYPPASLDIYRQLLVSSTEPTSKPYLTGAMEQIGVAQEHQTFMLEALNKGNLDEARHHVEHVVNILSGKGNPNYGDLDKNGTVENPGDDVGVIRYITQAIHVLSSVGSGGQTSFQKDQAAQAIANFNESLIIIQEITLLNQKLLATNNMDDAKSYASQAQVLLNQLVHGKNGKGGLRAADRNALAAVELPMLSGPAAPQLAPPGDSVDALGVFDLGAGGNFTFTLDGGYSAPHGMNYSLWASQPSSNQNLLLGSLPAGSLVLSGKTPAGNLKGYSQIVLSAESSQNTAPASPGQILLTGSLSPQVSDFYSKLLSPQDSNYLNKAREQEKIASDHLGYLITALKNNDLTMAKQHAEHVVNTLNGKSGPHYGDLNRDGVLEDPGDGVGVYGYLTLIGDTAQTLQKDTTLADSQKFYLERLLAAQKAALQQVNSAAETALKIVAADSPQEAQKTAETAQSLLNALLGSQGGNGSPLLDPFAAAGNLETIQLLAAGMQRVDLR